MLTRVSMASVLGFQFSVGAGRDRLGRQRPREIVEPPDVRFGLAVNGQDGQGEKSGEGCFRHVHGYAYRGRRVTRRPRIGRFHPTRVYL